MRLAFILYIMLSYNVMHLELKFFVGLLEKGAQFYLAMNQRTSIALERGARNSKL